MSEVFVGAPRMPVRRQVPTGRAQRQTVEMACSLLLDYPSDELAVQIGAVRAELDGLPAPVAGHLEAFCARAEALGLRALREHYVETFDQRRRCALYLSYYAEGDTRGRGQAILAFREIMRAAGFEQQREELTDYLPVVLEFAALDEQGMGEELLQTHREGLEVIRAALVDAGSPYAELLEALVATLPEPDAATTAAYHKLISQGPPTELVGLSAGPPGGIAAPPGPRPDPLAAPPATGAGGVPSESATFPKEG
ncbi:Nitrate reductase delta subunit [Propionibacterium ruminifibrarum]|uniref:Nitrate reductase delta subunit n=2 Tax=Propionibacterium ruminifibrarum TaxID=1962131 RepID=A0A375I689_9ACTN|nr:Nitrate reductase delta subunit [Propionibacterium ruminifibrarum]